MVHAMNAGKNGLERKEINNVLHNRLFLNNIRNNNNDIGDIMQLATEVFIDMMKSKEIYIIIGACIIMYIALERMDR